MIQAVGVTANEYTTIMNLSEAPNREMRMADLAECHWLVRESTTRLVDDLVMPRLCHQASKLALTARGNIAKLTPKGMAKLKTSWPATWRAFAIASSITWTPDRNRERGNGAERACDDHRNRKRSPGGRPLAASGRIGARNTAFSPASERRQTPCRGRDVRTMSTTSGTGVDPRPVALQLTGERHPD